MRHLPVFALSLTLFATIPSSAQDIPCDSEETLETYITSLSATVSSAFNKSKTSNSTADADTTKELASRANGDGLTNNRLDLIKKAFLAFNLGKIDEKDGDLVFNFNPETLNFARAGQFSPRVTVHRTELFKPLDQALDMLPESIRQSRKDILIKGIGELDDVEVNVRWTQASGTPRAGLQAVASEIFDKATLNNQNTLNQLNAEAAKTAADVRHIFGDPKDAIPLMTVCNNPGAKKLVAKLAKDIQTQGTQGLTELKTALAGTLFFKLADLIDGQPKFSANGSFRRRENGAGPPHERSFELRFDMGNVSYWGYQRFAASNKLDPAAPSTVSAYFAKKYNSTPNFSLSFDYVKTSDFSILLPVDATEFSQPESRKISAVATGGLYFGGGRAHRLELNASYDDISDDPTRHDRFVGTLSWIEKLNPTLTQALGGSDLTVTFVYANKPEFRGEVQHAFSLRAGLKWSVGGTTTK
ncbi:MAG: hypothetical protein WAM82_13400 [Thermoanaerobaculia bacterium]